jgi:hypothetical protein
MAANGNKLMSLYHRNINGNNINIMAKIVMAMCSWLMAAIIMANNNGLNNG